MLVKRPKNRTVEAANAREERTARFQEVRRIGRPPGARNRLSEAFIGDLHDTWADHGASILQQMLVDEPAKLAELVARLIPREFQVNVEQRAPGNLNPDEWQILVSLVTLIQANAPAGSKAMPTDIVPALEETVRAHFAKPVEST
jgi:hypothetical protein